MEPERIVANQEEEWVVRAKKTCGCNRIGRTAIARLITTAVAAAASVPSSLTFDISLMNHCRHHKVALSIHP